MKKVINLILTLYYNLTLPIVLVVFIIYGVKFFNHSDWRMWVMLTCIIVLVPFQFKFAKGLLTEGIYFYRETKYFKNVKSNLEKLKIHLD